MRETADVSSGALRAVRMAPAIGGPGMCRCIAIRPGNSQPPGHSPWWRVSSLRTPAATPRLCIHIPRAHCRYGGLCLDGGIWRGRQGPCGQMGAGPCFHSATRRWCLWCPNKGTQHNTALHLVVKSQLAYDYSALLMCFIDPRSCVPLGN